MQDVAPITPASSPEFKRAPMRVILHDFEPHRGGMITFPKRRRRTPQNQHSREPDSGHKALLLSMGGEDETRIDKA